MRASSRARERSPGDRQLRRWRNGCTLTPQRRASSRRNGDILELADQLAEQQRRSHSSRAPRTTSRHRRTCGAYPGSATRSAGPRRLGALLVGAGCSALCSAVAVGLSVFSSDLSPERFRAAFSVQRRCSPMPTARRRPRHRPAGGSSSTRRTATPRERRFYQASLHDTAGVIVPIGTSTRPRGRRSRAASPEGLHDADRHAQLADGDQASSGEKSSSGSVDTATG